MMKRLCAALSLALLLSGPGVQAQDYPSKVITIVVPFAAGGPTDTVTRLVAQAMSAALGQQVIVENVAGAGGTLGADRVAKAEADGYTLLLHHIGMATTMTLYRNLPYNSIEDFEPIGLVTEVPMTLVGKKDFPAASLAELIDYVKANKDTVTYANAGIGAASHLCGMLFMSAIETAGHDGALQGHGPGDERPAGRPGGFLVRPDHQHQQPDQGRRDQGLWGDHEGAAWRRWPTCRRWMRRGCPASKSSVWHGLYAPKGTRSR